MASVDNNNSQKCGKINNNTNNNYYNRIGLYDIISTIGHGNFAVCKLAQHRLTKTIVAIKFIDKTNLDATHLSRIYKEIEIMKCVNHKNIIKLYQVMESKHMLYLVCEYATNGELFEYILRNGAMSEKLACEKFYQIVNAVDYCHKKNIVHRDLKSENLLLDCNMNIKLADFGFANYYDMINPLKTFCGSAPYAAPEVFCGQQYFGPEIDVWSLGVILYVIVTGTLPFNSDNIQQLKQRVLACKYIIPDYLSAECIDLIQNILVVNSSQRYTLEQIKQHNWFKLNNIYFNTTTISTTTTTTTTTTPSTSFNSFIQREKFSNSKNDNISFSNSYESISSLISESANDMPQQQQIDNESFYDINVLNLMKSCGFDINETVYSLNQNLFNNNTAIYNFLKENKFNDSHQISTNQSDYYLNKSKTQASSSLSLNSNDKYKLTFNTSLNNNESSDQFINTNLIKRKDLLKTIKTHNKLHKNFISNSSSVDEGVESDFSSPTQSSSFSNDLLSSIASTTQLIIKTQPSVSSLSSSQQQQQQQQQTQSTIIPISTPPLTPPISRTSRTQNSNRSINGTSCCNKKQLNLNNSSNNSINNCNNKKSIFNPYDLCQIQRELKKLIKINSDNTNMMAKLPPPPPPPPPTQAQVPVSSEVIQHHLESRQQANIHKSKESHTTVKTNNIICKSIKTEANDIIRHLIRSPNSKSSNNLCENGDSSCKNSRKNSLK